jgi:DNA-binding NtrC family response regulator
MEPTVLFVDDDQLLQDGLRRALRGEPYRALWASSGEQALAMLGSQRIDVLVADHLMPGIGGVELLAEARASHPQVVAIMLTGQASAGSVVRALNDGNVFRLLLKPCNGDEIAVAVRLALAHKALGDRQRLVLPLLRRLNAVIERVNERFPGIAEDHRQTTPDAPHDPHALEALLAVVGSLDAEFRRAERSLTGLLPP